MSCLYPVEVFILYPQYREAGIPSVFHDFRKIPPSLKWKVKQTVRPCQLCIECRLRKSTETAILCVHTAQMYSHNCFLTLTYSDEHLPTDLSLSTDTIQKFWKRLRKSLPYKQIKHYSSGEYGDGDGVREINPHYHACLFNHDFPDKVFFKRTDRGDILYTSETLTNLWGLGHAVIGDLTFESAAYVARYTMKKVYGDPADEHYGDRLPEKSWSSNHLGLDWFNQYKASVYPHDFVVLSDGRTFAPPTKYDELLALSDPDMWETVQNNRAAKINVQKNNFQLERFYEDGKKKTRSVSDVVRRARIRVGSLDKKR